MTLEITFGTEGFKQLGRSFRGARTVTNGGINRTLRQIGTLLVPILKSETPVRTRRLRNSTRFQIVGGTDNQRLEIRQGARNAGGEFYGRIVRRGSRPHVIRPRVKKALVFQIGGRTIFAKKVNHPGTRANPYHLRTLQRADADINRIVRGNAIQVVATLLDIGQVS